MVAWCHSVKDFFFKIIMNKEITQRTNAKLNKFDLFNIRRSESYY